MIYFRTIDKRFSTPQIAKLYDALRKANLALESPGFRAFLLAASPIEESFDGGWDIYAAITQVVKVDVRVWRTLYARLSKAIAREADGAVEFNAYRFDGLSVDDVASCLIHEAGHAVGYTHESNSKFKAWNTPCYWLNRAYEQSVKQWRNHENIQAN